MSARPSISVVVLGNKETAAALKKAGDAVPHAIRAATYSVALSILEPAVKMAPKRTGVLRGSGYATLPEPKGRTFESEVGFGGPAKAYAWDQHENTAYRHREGEDHYLSKSVDAAQKNITATYTDFLRQALERGAGPKLTPLAPTDPYQNAQKAAAKEAAKAQVDTARAAARAKKKAAQARKRAVKKAVKSAKRAARAGLKKAAKAAQKTVRKLKPGRRGPPRRRR